MSGECERMERLMVDYALGELDCSQAEAVEEHVRACPWCAEALGEAQRIVSAVSGQEMTEPSAAVCESVMDAVKERVLGRRRVVSAAAELVESFVRRPVLVGASALLAIAVVTVLVVLRAPGPKTDKTPAGTIRIGRGGKVLTELTNYLSQSQELIGSALGMGAAEAFSSYSRDDLLMLIGQAMYLQKTEGLEAHRGLLMDLEKFYREIGDCNGEFGAEEVRRMRELVSESRLRERVRETLDLWR